MSTTLVVGLGCQRGCPASLLLELMEQNLAAHGFLIEAITALASIDQKSAEPGLLALATQLALPLVFFSSAELADFDAQLSHRSALAFAHTGCHGVAESAALALAQRLSGHPGTLLINRSKNRRATFALAGDVPNRR
ncbi:cobalamin biosynthesis protein [Pseudomonas sp. CCI3.2]|uniref:cobalamin biosynthesis protein n=1 Tax=unclassified Pseudomonas TaxID=196821 RepID=UPI002AC8B665|nr:MULTISPECIES: cobalamin biosynthesis protein [unclassified Pseudomonas]MEB0076194.1 cobalamin biosynthesis protein [Pseudomonas sp. MH10out]MEB0090689.1 cobalamin biosynthesis protein [Pseudomonas sp. CCI4.2]MEB0100633.1 cobalamin biosynthesis protein [Pseudomonas sp. CCI3.2]MEB0131864.1 cobalamin biosynthesis protein [Pseudomonas sp. CCI2.4]MEB0156053.1 cobalamin biosynthesis protein [Pseudomonas sp. AH2 (2023)]